MANIVRPPCDEGVVLGGAPAAACSAQLGRWVLAAAILGSSMAFIDGTVVNVALPALQTALGADLLDIQWVVESYALTLAALLLFGGAAGDRFGRRRIFGLGVAVFAAASAWCGVAPSVGQLVAARAVQGFGAALLVPGSLALLSETFSDAQRGRAIGTWAGATAITSAGGPVLGGWLVEQASWRAIFFINLPVAAIVLAILWARVPERGERTAGAGVDWAGAGLASFGLGAVVYGLIEAGRLGFEHWSVLAALAGGALLLAAFVAVEARTREPMLPLSLFRSATFSGVNALTVLLYGALGGALFFVPLNLIQVQGYSATEAGAAFLPFILIVFLLSRWAGGLTHRHGPRLPLVVGPAVAAAGYVLFSVPGIGGSYWVSFFPPMVVLGLGMAIAAAPLTTTVMEAVAAERAGVASGVNNAAARVAGLLAVAAMGLLVLDAFQRRLAPELDALGLSPGIRNQLEAGAVQLAALEAPAGLEAPAARAVEHAVDAAFVGGFRVVMLVAAALAALSALTAVWTLTRRVAPVDWPRSGH